MRSQLIHTLQVPTVGGACFLVDPNMVVHMSTNDQNARPEQKRPKDVSPRAEDEEFVDEESLAPAGIQPAGSKDESERPVVNPVSGVAI